MNSRIHDRVLSFQEDLLGHILAFHCVDLHPVYHPFYHLSLDQTKFIHDL